MNYKILLSFACWLIVCCVHAQNLSAHFKIYDTRNKSVSSLEAIVNYAGEHDVLFFGEEHNDSIGHFVQDTLYKSLIAKYRNVTLSMEMFERDCQVVVDEYTNGFITESQLIKEGRAWKNYKDYAKLVNTARQHHQKVIAANAPRRYVNLVNRKGLLSLDKLDKESKKYFAPLPIDTSNVKYSEKFESLMGNQGHSPNRNLFYSQCLWDATMAHSIYDGWKKNKKVKILHLNGRFHSDEKMGTVAQLQHKNKQLKIGTISCFSADDFQSPDWSKYQHLADFIIVTDPAIPKSF